jgi:hypothetical protein
VSRRRRRRSCRRPPAWDGVQTKGAFLLPPGLAFAPDTAPVTLRLTDGTGATWYAVTLPAGSCLASGSRRSFKFTDRTLALAGVKTAKFSISRGTTVKYAFKLSGRDQPAFAAGTASALIQVGPWTSPTRAPSRRRGRAPAASEPQRHGAGRRASVTALRASR